MKDCTSFNCKELKTLSPKPSQLKQCFGYFIKEFLLVHPIGPASCIVSIPLVYDMHIMLGINTTTY